LGCAHHGHLGWGPGRRRLLGDELGEGEAERPSEPGFGADIHQGSGADLTWSTDALPHGIEAGRSGAPHDSEGTSAEGESGGEDAKIFEWLRELDAIGTRPEQPPGMSSAAPSEDVPDWVDSMTGVQMPTYLSSGPTDTLPDWLSEPPPAEAGSKGQLLDASRPEMPQAPQPHDSADETGAIAPQEVPVDAPAPVPATSDVVPAFPPEEIRQLDVDAVFASMHMPDWLTELQPLQASSQDASSRPGLRTHLSCRPALVGAGNAPGRIHRRAGRGSFRRRTSA
jgi:hypothetical protein